MAEPTRPTPPRKRGLFGLFAKRGREEKFFLYVKVESSTRRAPDELVDDSIDYARGAQLLSNARQVDEIDPPLGGSPFGA